ncbi:hypothetical protein B0H14DRAFT_860014 [Mycena olivaceomarginata]|nr:hypothetical protein B0H14DRAFT_860014 [Mycena olivaceomarginata]
MYRMGSARRRTRGIQVRLLAFPDLTAAQTPAALSCVSAPSVGTAAQPREIRGGRGRGRQTARRRRAENARRCTAHGVQAVNSPLSISSAAREMAAPPPQVPEVHSGAAAAGQEGSGRRVEKAGTFPSFQFGAVQR